MNEAWNVSHFIWRKKKAPPKKTMTAPVAPPPVKRGPTAEDLRLQEEQELAAFEAEGEPWFFFF